MKKNRFYLEEVITRLMTEESELSFYGFLIAQCKINIDKSLPAPAAVMFDGTQYCMTINPVIFNRFNEKEKTAILIHEALHIAFNHITVRLHEDFERWNYATDIAINQLIKNLPEGGLTPEMYNLPYNLSAEEYFELLAGNEKYIRDKEQKQDNTDKIKKIIDEAIKEGSYDITSSETSEDGSELSISKDIDIPIDVHSHENKGEDTYREEITKNMLNKSMEKSKGHVPVNYTDLLSLYDRPSKVDWRRVLRTIVGNKKSSKRKTYKRLDRRFYDRDEIKGTMKNKTFELAVILDVSGSMSNDEIKKGLNEIKIICKLTKSNIKIIQIDVQVQEVSDFNENTKTINRAGCGGTFIYPGIKYLDDNKIHYDALVVITDMDIEDISQWDKIPKIPCMFLDTSGKHDSWSGFSYRNINYYDISK